MKKTIILAKGNSEGVLECVFGDDNINVKCRFVNKGEFELDADYILYLCSAKRPSNIPYAIAEGNVKCDEVYFCGCVKSDILQKYGYVPLDIDTFIICERKYGETNYKLFAKGFTGLIWNVDVMASQMADASVNSAKKALIEMKRTENSLQMIKLRDEYIKCIKTELNNYKRVSFEPPYSWYFVNKTEPVYNLSSLKHILFAPAAVEAVYRNGGYYMGIYKNHLALAVKMLNDNVPFTTLSDVTQIIKKNNNDGSVDKYCTAGIFLDDDGQYFEKILAIE